MDAVKGVLETIVGTMRGVFAVIGSVIDMLAGFGPYIFLLGFFGVLFTFLWFFFRYLDKKKLALPTIVFTLFFVIFLGGSSLVFLHGPQAAEASEEAAETIAAESEEGGGESV